MKTEKEIIEETLLEATKMLWLCEQNLIRAEAKAKNIKNRELSEDPEYTRIEGMYSAYRNLLVTLKSKLGNSDYSLYFNHLSIKD